MKTRVTQVHAYAHLGKIATKDLEPRSICKRRQRTVLVCIACLTSSPMEIKKRQGKKKTDTSFWIREKIEATQDLQ